MKKIEISPEWILEKSTVTHHVDGKGNITISSDSVSDAHWIDITLKTLGIKFESSCVGCDTNPNTQYLEIEWKFNIEEIRLDCPNLYTKWLTMNDAQAYRIWVAQKLIDSIEVKEVLKPNDIE